MNHPKPTLRIKKRNLKKRFVAYKLQSRGNEKTKVKEEKAWTPRQSTHQNGHASSRNHHPTTENYHEKYKTKQKNKT